MEREGDTLTMPPFWAPDGGENHLNRRRLRRSYSLLLTFTSFLVPFLVLALVFTLVVVPTLRSFASNIFRPHTFKNSWDSLNLVLVLFAIVCGFLSKNNTTETKTPRSHHHRTFSNPSTPPPLYQYSDTDRSLSRLRSFNSYPDLRQHSSLVASDERYRFYDDTHLLLRHRQSRPEAEQEEEEEMYFENVADEPLRTKTVRRNVKRTYQKELNDVAAENFQPPPQSPPSPPPQPQTEAFRIDARRTYQKELIEKPERNDVVSEISQLPASAPPQSPPSPPPKQQTKAFRRNAKRTYQKELIEKPERNDVTSENWQPPVSPPPQPRTKPVRRIAKRTYQEEASEKPERNDSVATSSQPPPPLPPPPLPAERNAVQGKKKRGISTKEFLTSWKGKKKKQRQKSVENFDSILNSEPFSLTPQLPPSPPPSVFQNLFSPKKGKHKKRHIVSVATSHISNKREHSSSYSLEDNVMIPGNESPFIPIPPPPPPPPFKLPAWKFRVQGDFVRVDSIGSSRSGSPDLDEVNGNVDSPTSNTQDETSQCNSPFAPDGDGPSTATVTAASLFCPSPDVDTKAHNFIESFRAGLRMAKMNSMKEKREIGRSNLGPSLYSQTIYGSRTN